MGRRSELWATSPQTSTCRMFSATGHRGDLDWTKPWEATGHPTRMAATGESWPAVPRVPEAAGGLLAVPKVSDTHLPSAPAVPP